jgi:hypothetical protein
MTMKNRFLLLLVLVLVLLLLITYMRDMNKRCKSAPYHVCHEISHSEEVQIDSRQIRTFFFLFLHHAT